jgi:transcriptional regulator with XRE-family HTH domain
VNNLRDKKLLIAFGNHLKKIRTEKKLTLENLAFEADIEISQVFRMEKGLINPTLSSLNAIAKALNISLNKLMEF